MPVFNFSKSDSSYSILNGETAIDFLKPTATNYVRADQAIKNSDVFSLIMQLSSDLALVKLNSKTDRATSLLNNPATTTSGFSFWQSIFAQLLLDGNAYAYRWRNVNGVDLRWEYLRPSQVQVMLLSDGSGLIYNLNFGESEVGLMNNVSARDMIHFKLMSRNGGMTGISPLSALANEMRIKHESDNLTLKALQQSITASSVLTVSHGSKLNYKLRAARSREFKWQMDHSNGGPVVLDDMEKYDTLEVKSNIAQLLSQVDWTSKQVAKVYGVPDSYLNGQGDQQSSIEQMGGQYAKSLNRFVQPVVSELNSKLNADVTADIRPAIDATGDAFADTITGLVSSNVLSADQAQYLLRQTGYLPADLPEMKGGEMDENN